MKMDFKIKTGATLEEAREAGKSFIKKCLTAIEDISEQLEKKEEAK